MIAGNEEAHPPTSELIGMGVAVIVLLFAFGSVIAMGLPLFTAILGLGIGLTGITLMSAVVDLSSTAPTLATMIGLAVGIDYALFIVTRHRQNLAEGMTVEEAAARANATAGSAVVFAGGTVVIAISGLAIVGIPFLTVMGLATAATVAIAVIVAVTLLPVTLDSPTSARCARAAHGAPRCRRGADLTSAVRCGGWCAGRHVERRSERHSASGGANPSVRRP